MSSALGAADRKADKAVNSVTMEEGNGVIIWSRPA
jgi:hypothetical protein